MAFTLPVVPVLVAGLLYLAGAAPSAACTCLPRAKSISPGDEAAALYEGAGAVAILKVLKVGSNPERPFDARTADVELIESFKGPRDITQIQTNGVVAACGVGFRMNEHRLYFIDTDGKVYLCSNYFINGQDALVEELRKLKREGQ